MMRRWFAAMLVAVVAATGLSVAPAAAAVQPAAPEVSKVETVRGSATLHWGDVSGAAGYNVYRNGQYLTTVSGSPFRDGNSPGEYTYYVTAFDSTKQQFSGRSNEVPADTRGTSVWPSGGGSSAPAPAAPVDSLSAPTLSKVDTVRGSATLHWADVSGAAGYNVYRNGQYLTTVSGSPFRDGNSPGEYTYYVTAFDGSKQVFSPRSNELRADTRGTSTSGGGSAPAPEETGALVPPTIRAMHDGPSTVVVTWQAVPGAAKYNVYRDGAYTATTSFLRWEDTIDQPGLHVYEVVSVDAGARRFSPKSVAARALVAPQLPDAPVLDVSATGELTVNWKAHALSASTAVVYEVRQDNRVIARTSGTSAKVGVSSGDHSISVVPVANAQTSGGGALELDPNDLNGPMVPSSASYEGIRLSPTTTGLELAEQIELTKEEAEAIFVGRAANRVLVVLGPFSSAPPIAKFVDGVLGLGTAEEYDMREEAVHRTTAEFYGELNRRIEARGEEWSLGDLVFDTTTGRTSLRSDHLIEISNYLQVNNQQMRGMSWEEVLMDLREIVTGSRAPVPGPQDSDCVGSHDAAARCSVPDPCEGSMDAAASCGTGPTTPAPGPGSCEGSMDAAASCGTGPTTPTPAPSPGPGSCEGSMDAAASCGTGPSFDDDDDDDHRNDDDDDDGPGRCEGSMDAAASC